MKSLVGICLCLLISCCYGRIESSFLSIFRKSKEGLISRIPFFRRRQFPAAAAEPKEDVDFMNTKPVENWTLNDWKHRVEELRAEVDSLKTQLQVAKSNRTQWIKDKANMQREFASQLSQRDAVHRIQKEELLEHMRIQYEADAKKLVQKLQQEHALQIQDLETLFRESSEREQAELKKQLSETNLLVNEAQMAILKLRAELQQLHLEEQAKAEKNFQESSHYIQVALFNFASF